jgi:tetratricopeptide (TPR) repeat protein/transglutaminase-like putative cysteine protease
MRRVSRRIFSLLVIIFFNVEPSAIANETWPVARGPSREPNPYRYDAKQWQSIPKEFLEDSAACVLYAGNFYHLEADGTVENITHEVTRLNGRKGVEKLGEYRHITYDPAYQKLTLNEALLHKADGRLLAVEPRHVQLRDVSTDYQVYDHEKQLIISFPNLEVGDTLEVKWTIRGRNPEHGGHFFTRYDFGDPSYPVVLDELRVSLPVGRSFKYAAIGAQIEPITTEEDGLRSYDWKVRNVKQLPQDENLPPKEELRKSVVCSTFPSWEEIGRWKLTLRADSWVVPPEIRTVVAEITHGLAEPAAKARALTMWLRRNIRYVSSGERHDYTPHPPARVFANRFGDCKDTSQLLAVMLREAGLDVSLATLGTLDDGQVVESVPSPWGTHAILLVSLPDGEHWIDTTLSLGGWDYLPRDDRDRLCYIVHSGGNVTLRRTTPQTADANRYDQTTHVRIGSDGSSRCERTVTTYGAAALGQRDTFVEVPPGERRRQVAAELQEANNRARLLRLAFDEDCLQDFDRPVTSRITFEIPSHFVGNTEREGSISDSRTWARLLAFNVDYDRQVDFELPSPFESRHRYVIHLPAAYALEDAPRERIITSRWGRFEVRVQSPKDAGSIRRLEITFLARLEKTRVEAAHFGEFRRFQEEVTKAYRVWLTLKPASEPSDIPVLEGIAAFVPDDASSALVLARLYYQLGRAADARRVLQRARFYRPDDSSLWEFSVQCAPNADEEEAARQELTRRFPSESKYRLGLGTLLVQQGKLDAAGELLEPLVADGIPAERAQANLQLAMGYDRAGKSSLALKFLTAAEDADPDTVLSAKSILLRGRICESLGKHEEAAAAYRRAAALEHDAVDALNGLVRLSLIANNRSEAVEFLRRFTVAVGDETGGLLQAAGYHLRLGRLDEAAELATKAGRKRSEGEAERILGLVHLQRGEYALALARLEKAIPRADTVAGTIRAMLAEGIVSGVRDQLVRAQGVKDANDELRSACASANAVLRRRAELERIAPQGPASANAWSRALDCLACAEHARKQGRTSTLVARLLAGAFVGSDGPGPAFALRARLALESGKLARALADSQRAIALSPEDSEGYFVRGRVRLERSDPGAAADLEKAAALSGGKDPDVLHALADAHYRAGNRERALQLQRQAAKLRPDDREIAEQLAVFEKAKAPASTGS